MLGEIGESWRFVHRDRRLLIALLQLSFGNILLLVIGQLAPKFVGELLHRPPANAALVFVPAGVGLVVGSALMPRVVKRLGKARSISAGIIGLSLTSILLVVSQRVAQDIDPHQWYNDWPFLAVIIGLIFALGCELDLMNIPALALIQEHTPDTIKGRVLSLQSIIYNAASIPVILFIGGIADIYGIAIVMWVLAGMVFGGGLLSVFLDARVSARTTRKLSALVSSPEQEAGVYEQELETLLPSNIPK